MTTEPARFAPPSASERDGLARGRAAGILSALDLQFAERLAAHYGETRPGVRLALAVACRQEAAGHVCADLERLAREGFGPERGSSGEIDSIPLPLPSLESWLEELASSPLVSRLGGAEGAEEAAARPLVLDDEGRLYLARAYHAERELAQRILERASAPDLPCDDELAASLLAKGPANGDEAARAALQAAATRPLSILTGGPGTGKTTLAASLVALVSGQAQAAGQPLPRVRLLAPTGKAAAALTLAFARQQTSLGLPEALAADESLTASTLHRALAAQTRSDALGRSRVAPLEADLVLVDEASMVDLAWMKRLFEAAADAARIVLLGDPDQLASVEAGAVLADLCAAAAATGAAEPRLAPDREASSVGGARARSRGRPAVTGTATAPTEPVQGELFAPRGSPGAMQEVARAPFERANALSRSVVRLTRAHRFAGEGGIAQLAAAIRRGDASAVFALLADPDRPEVEWRAVDSIAATRQRLVEASREAHLAIDAAADASAKLERLALYRVLCAHRRGPLGVEGLCPLLDGEAARIHHARTGSEWWRGRMLLVTHNAPDQNLWNGDVGLIEETEAGLRALFPDAHGGIRALSAARLPAHESAIAMSVHKSQGSEFEVVDLVIGALDSRLLSRELLYTGATRARKQLRIHASEAALRAALGRRVARDSGLRARLVGR